MILEGPMIILAVLAMTILHPSIAFSGKWIGKWSSAASSVKQYRKAASTMGSWYVEDIPLQQRYNP